MSLLDNQIISDFHPNDGEGHPDNSKYIFPHSTSTFGVGYNLVININGQQFPGDYQWSGGDYYNGFYAKRFLDSNGEVVRDEATIRAYLEFMLGTTYVPHYDREKPNNLFILLTGYEYTDLLWKYQYDNDNGLLAFRVDGFPFAAKAWVESYINSLQNQIDNLSNGSGGGSSSGHERFSFGYNLVVNSNGAQIDRFRWVDASDPTGLDQYRVKVLKYNYDGDFVTDLDDIKEYMRFMTGCDFVPEYNETQPKDTFIYLTSYGDSEKLWKYQLTQNPHRGDYMLYAFRVDNSPFNQIFNELNAIASFINERYPRYIGTLDTDGSGQKLLRLDLRAYENHRPIRIYGSFICGTQDGGTAEESVCYEFAHHTDDMYAYIDQVFAQTGCIVSVGVDNYDLVITFNPQNYVDANLYVYQA